MENNLPQKRAYDSLRCRAEAIVNEKKPQKAGTLSESELKIMQYEFDVREAELELLKEEFEKSEIEHNLLFDTLPMGVVYLDTQGNMINANQSATEILGLSINQLKERTSFDPRWQAIHEDGTDFAGDTRPAMVALHTGRIVKDVVMGVFNPAKAGITWLKINAVPLFIPGQTQPYQVYIIFDDITGQKQIETALRGSEERFRLVTELTTDYFFKLDVGENGSITMSYVSGNHYAATGRTLEEVRSPEFWTSIIYPDDLGKAMEMLKRIISSGGSGDIECRTYHKNGQIRWVHIFAKANRDYVSGRVESLIGAVKNIDERKKSEEDLRAAGERWESTFNVISEFISILDKDHRIVQCNKAMAQFLEHTKGEITGKHCYEIFHGTDTPPENCALALMKADCLTHEEEMYSEILDRYFLVTISPIFGASGHLAGCIHVARDITERKQNELSLIESEMRYRELFNNISSGVAIYEVKDNGDDFIFKDFNRAGERIDHTRKQDLVGKNILEVRPGIKDFGLLDVFKRVWRTGIPEHFPESFYTDNKLSGFYENYVYRLPSGEIVAVFDNVTKKKQIESALENETELLRLTMASIGDGVITTDIDGRITMMNSKAEEITGWPQADALHQEFSEVFRIINEETREACPNPVDKVLRTGKIAGLANHTVLIRKDNTERIIADTGSPIITGKGIILGVVIIFRDITEKHASDNALKKSEKQYRELINTLQEGVWVIDKDAHTRFVNPRMAEILGYTAEEMTGKHLFAFMDEETIEITKGLISRRKDGIKEQVESRFIKKDGTQVPVLLETGPIIDENGNYEGAIAGVMDITEKHKVQKALRKSEQDYLGLINTLQEGVWVVDKDAITTFVNPRMAEILGYTPEEMIGKHLFSFMDEKIVEDAKQKFNNRREGIKEQHEFSFMKKDGTQILALLEAGPILDADGNFAGAVAGVIDITERKQMQDMLVMREMELQRLTGRLMQVREEERNTIARDIHDDIGHMVMMIKMNLFLLEKKSDQQGKLAKNDFDETRELIDRLIESIQRIALEIRPAILYDLGLPEALRFFVIRFEKQTNIRCVLNIPSEIRGLPDESAIALYRIIQEAFVNIYRHAEASEITVDFDRIENHITLSIRDNGKGIPKDRINHINSLGILGMKERAFFLKGMLYIDGHEGEGTLVRLTFPLAVNGEGK